MKNSPKKGEAIAFLDWIRSPEVQQHLKDFGLVAVE
jgi:ABC-type glycerol-3-phosphate transport system substrate-binding protein